MRLLYLQFPEPGKPHHRLLSHHCSDLWSHKRPPPAPITTTRNFLWPQSLKLHVTSPHPPRHSQSCFLVCFHSISQSEITWLIHFSWSMTFPAEYKFNEREDHLVPSKKASDHCVLTTTVLFNRSYFTKVIVYGFRAGRLERQLSHCRFSVHCLSLKLAWWNCIRTLLAIILVGVESLITWISLNYPY